MNGKVFEIGTDVHEIVPRPTSEEVQDIVHVAFTEAMSLEGKQRQEVGRYFAQLSKSLLEKKG